MYYIFRLLKMAAIRAAIFLFRRNFVNKNVIKFSIYSNPLCTFNSGYARDPAEVFFREDVQMLLQQITGCNYEKVFRNRKLGQKLDPPKYELLTQAEIENIMEETERKLKLKLKMPPLLKERQPVDNTLARNSEIQGFDTAKYVFIDISQGITDKDRMVVVRDPSGVLRVASWEERHKMCQIYLPSPGRKINMPKMFEEDHLKDCLIREEYEFILDRACVQFEPNDPNYIRVTRMTYDVINCNGHFSALRSTRHFGPMALHLVLSKSADDLLVYFLKKKEIDAAADLVRLHHITHATVTPDQSGEFNLIEDYIENHALKKPTLELAWNTFLEVEKQQQVEKN